MNFIITNELHISVADYTGKSRDLNPYTWEIIILCENNWINLIKVNSIF